MTAEEIAEVVERAFDYRGDVTVTLRNGGVVQGYVFDRRPGQAIRVLPSDGRGVRLSIAWEDIAAIDLSGRDTAAGKSWEAWVAKYNERKAAGETGIALEPEPLDQL